MKRPLSLWPLLFLLLFLAVGGLYGGIAMLADPGGDLIGLAHILPRLPVSDFTLPGLFLLIVMGITPLVLIFGLLRRSRWAWRVTLALDITLVLWLTFQAILIGFGEPIQLITAIDGALILLLALTPGIRRYCSS